MRGTKIISMSPFVLAVAILVVIAMIHGETKNSGAERGSDRPPSIDFTWWPETPADLTELRGHLVMSDDYGLDFSTYRMTLVEMGRTLDLPIDGMIGRQYEQDVSLGMFADEMAALDSGYLTLQFMIADDRGQQTEVTRKIEFR